MVTLPSSRCCRGSVLFLVLWAVALTSVLILTWASAVGFRLDRFNLQGDRDKARFAALSGLTLAMNGQLPEESELFESQELAPDLSFQVVIESEGARLNLNYLIARTLLDEGVREQFRRFLEITFAVPAEEQDPLIDAFLDWVDADDIRRLNGIEREDGYRAGNRYFNTIDEIATVRGAEWMTRNEGWRDKLTLWSQGRIDINWAAPELLAALPGIDERDAEFIQNRIAGLDGELHTSDDERFASVAELREFVSFSDAEFNLLSPWITTNEPAKRISATGRSYDVTHRIDVVAQGRNANAVIKSWIEP